MITPVRARLLLVRPERFDDTNASLQHAAQHIQARQRKALEKIIRKTCYVSSERDNSAVRFRVIELTVGRWPKRSGPLLAGKGPS